MANSQRLLRTKNFKTKGNVDIGKGCVKQNVVYVPACKWCQSLDNVFF